LYLLGFNAAFGLHFGKINYAEPSSAGDSR